MANKGDEQQKPKPGEVVMPAEADEDVTENAQPESADVADEPSNDSDDQQESDTEGQLGDEEVVMPDNGNEPPKQPGKIKRFFAGYWHKKAWTLPLTLLVVVATLFAVPATRYGILAHFWRKQVSFVVLDAQTHKPVSSAAIEIQHGSYRQGTFVDSQGKVTVGIPVGPASVTVAKHYYKTQKEMIFVSIKTPGVNTIYLTATGRQVPIKVVNKITGDPVSGAVVSAAGTSSQTGTDGTATMVLPADKATVSGTITPAGTSYNNADVTIQVSTHPGSADTFQVTPSGRAYFLSNLSGTIDVVSTHLDGTDRKTVLAGTGDEDPNGTVLLASSDWKYLALLSKRDTGKSPMLFLVSTADDQLTTIDSTDGSYTPIGWSGHYFVYQVGHLVKSFNADSGNSVTLVNAATADPNDPNGVFQAVWDAIIDGDKLFYDMTWYQNPGYLQVPGKQNKLGVINVDGTNSKVLKQVDAGKYYFSNLELYKPGALYLGMYTSGDSGNVTYYRIDANDNVVQDNTVTANTFTRTHPTYLQSPSGNKAFWSQQRDGKNTLLVGAADGSNGQQVATLSDYVPYGWYTDKYLLVEKNGSELGIMPANGGNILKISDYYKPPSSTYGSGGSYGGL